MAGSAKTAQAKSPVGRKRNREGSGSGEFQKRLAEALAQHAAISEILNVMSASPSDVQPVLDAVAERAAHLCEAPLARVLLVDGDVFRAMAWYSLDGTSQPHMPPLPLKRTTIVGRAVLDHATIHHDDVVPLLETEYPDASNARRLGLRAVLAVPLIREGNAYGAILLWRREPGLFSREQVALVQTFAQQAAIAVENVRLFNETKEALEQQTATSEILRVISESPTDVQPVFDTIASAAQRLCAATSANLFTFDGQLLHLTARARPIPGSNDAADLLGLRTEFPRPPGPDLAAPRAVLTCSVVSIPDVLADTEYKFKDVAVASGFRSVLAVPLIRDGAPIGAIVVGRSEPGQFPDKQLALLQTFAAQAVIAIENVRLFDEVQAHARELSVSLQQQTATADVLKVISRSAFDLQKVLDTLTESACKLCEADTASMLRPNGDVFTIAAMFGQSPAYEAALKQVAITPGRNTCSGRALLEARTVHIDDAALDPEYNVPDVLKAAGNRAMIGVPLLREGAPIGVLVLTRSVARPFSEKQIALATTFADQAVIAIENVRLFKETKEALDQQRASGEVLAAISSSIADTNPVFDKILASCERLFAGKVVSINLVGDDGMIRIAHYRGPGLDKVKDIAFGTVVPGETATANAIIQREVQHLPDVLNGQDVPGGTRRSCEAVGTRAVIVAPMIWGDRGIGSITVGRDYVGPFTDREIALLKTFADQAVIAIQNARLFREIEDKSRELEMASQHKSEFLANMSHELRTPLNAIIGFSEVLAERLFGEINEKQAEYLGDILESGRHLLSLINDILDLSKIEAGRMELEPTTFHLPSVIENALTIVRERAQRHGIALGRTVDERLGMIHADERKVKQVLLNLLSNALKFTPEGGRIDVRAAARDEAVEISVTDTGVGIAPEDQATVFEEFRQVGSAAKKVEGTGLGLAISRKFIDLHGGKIWVDSQVGKGSTFAFTLPLPVDQHDHPA